MARTHEASQLQVYVLCSTGAAEQETSGRETEGGSGELRPPIFDSVPSMSVHIIGQHFVLCVFPFAGTIQLSIGNSKGEAQLREIEGVAC